MVAWPRRKLLLAAVSRVSPDFPRRIGLVEQSLAQHCTIIQGSIGGLPFADEAEAGVDRDMVLIAVGRDGDVDRRLGPVGLLLGFLELHRPTGVAVLVAKFGGTSLPAVRNMPLFDRLPLLVGHALLGCRHQRGVDDLAGHGDCSRRRAAQRRNGRTAA